MTGLQAFLCFSYPVFAANKIGRRGTSLLQREMRLWRDAPSIPGTRRSPRSQRLKLWGFSCSSSELTVSYIMRLYSSIRGHLNTSGTHPTVALGGGKTASFNKMFCPKWLEKKATKVQRQSIPAEHWAKELQLEICLNVVSASLRNAGKERWPRVTWGKRYRLWLQAHRTGACPLLTSFPAPPMSSWVSGQCLKQQLLPLVGSWVKNEDHVSTENWLLRKTLACPDGEWCAESGRLRWDAPAVFVAWEAVERLVSQELSGKEAGSVDGGRERL